MTVCRGHRAENMQFAGKGWPLLIEGMAQLLILQKCLLGKHSQLFTRFGQRDRAVITHKQRLAEIFFQPLDLPGERGGADVHRPRAAAKVAAFRQMQEGF